MSQYYKQGTSAVALPLRLKALRKHIVPGSTLLDIGTLDGTIPRELMKTGHVSNAHGIDIVNKWYDPDQEPWIKFTTMDIMDADLTAIEKYDVILLLNILHHLIAKDLHRARYVIRNLYWKCDKLFVDMGSFTETWESGSGYQDDPWEKVIRKWWKSDEEMWDDLFAKMYRESVLKYGQRGGIRTMFLIRSWTGSMRWEEEE